MGWVPVLAAIVSAVAVVTAAIFTAVQTNKRGPREKIWDAKSQAYAEMFEALDDMGQWVDVVSEDTQRDFRITPQFERQKRKQFEVAYQAMRKAVVRRTGVLSDEVEVAVNAFFSELRLADKDGEWDSHVRRKTSAVGDAWALLKRLARKDLGLPLEGRAQRKQGSRIALRGQSYGLFLGAMHPPVAHRPDYESALGMVTRRRNGEPKLSIRRNRAGSDDLV